MIHWLFEMNATYSYAQIKTNMHLIYSKQYLEFVFIVMRKIIYDENSQAENWIMHNIHDQMWRW